MKRHTAFESATDYNTHSAPQFIHDIQVSIGSAIPGWRMSPKEPYTGTTPSGRVSVEALPYATDSTTDSAQYMKWIQRPIRSVNTNIIAVGREAHIKSPHPNTQIAAEGISDIHIAQSPGWTFSDDGETRTYRDPGTTFTRMSWNIGGEKVIVAIETVASSGQICSVRGQDAKGKMFERYEMEDIVQADVTRFVGQADHVLSLAFDAGYLGRATESMAGATQASAA